MRIGIVAPPWMPLPPQGYGGSERVVHLLADSLGKAGHDVVVLGCEGSTGAYELVPLSDPSWIDDLDGRDYDMKEALYFSRVYSKVRDLELDVLHEHNTRGFPFGLLACPELPQVVTIHTAYSQPIQDLCRELGDAASVLAISQHQMNSAVGFSPVGFVYNGIITDDLTFGEQPQPYLVQLARISPEKGQHRSIGVARELGLPLVLAGKVDWGCDDYFRDMVLPHLGEGSDVTWVEEVTGAVRADLLANASAQLYPISWDEPFGLAVVEAMFSGTPTVALRRGAMPELIQDGIGGYVVDTTEHMTKAVAAALEISRTECSLSAATRFSGKAMAAGYLQEYEREIQRRVTRRA